MPKKIPASGSSSGGASFTVDELEIAGVLLRLPELILNSESAFRLPPLWGAKRRRSFLKAPPASSSPVLLPVTGKLDYVSNSPTSPLAFPSHTDFDSKLAAQNLKSETADFKDVKAMELFPGEQSMAENINKRRRLENLQCGISNSDALELKLFIQSKPLDPHHQQESQFRYQMGPMGIVPDLNVPAEVYAAELECRTRMPEFDYHHQVYHHVVAAAKGRAEAAALARQRRHLIQKSKKATRGRR